MRKQSTSRPVRWQRRSAGHSALLLESLDWLRRLSAVNIDALTWELAYGNGAARIIESWRTGSELLLSEPSERAMYRAYLDSL